MRKLHAIFSWLCTIRSRQMAVILETQLWNGTSTKLVAVPSCILLFGVCLYAQASLAQSTAKSLVEQGEKLVSREQTLPARRAFEQALAAEPCNADALRDLSLLFLLTGDDEPAARHSRQLVAVAPRDEQGLLIYAIALSNRWKGNGGGPLAFERACANHSSSRRLVGCRATTGFD